MFNTAHLEDKRLPSKEHIIGFRADDKNEHVADVFENTPDYGQLERVYIYNSVLWGVWASYCPNSEVLN